MVDLVGIEPTTSSMPWNDHRSRPLILKELLTGLVGKAGGKAVICYQFATKTLSIRKWVSEG